MMTGDNGGVQPQQQNMFPQANDIAAAVIAAMQQVPQQPQQQNVAQSHVDPAMAAMLMEWDRLNKIPGQVGEDARAGVGVRVLDMARAGKRPLVRDYERITQDTPILAETYVVADVWSKGRALFPEFVPTPMEAFKFLGGLFS
jgi:hypothetical protein